VTVTLDNNWDNKRTLFPAVTFLKCTTEVLFSIVALKALDISQGSVATHLRCSGIFTDDIITNFLLILTINNCENRLIFRKVKAHKTTVLIFGPPCKTTTNCKCYWIAALPGNIKYSRRDNIADSAHFRETAKDAGAA